MTTQEEPHLLVIPLLEEEQLKLFFRLAMEMAAIVQKRGDEWENKPKEEDPIHDSSHIA